MNQNQKLLSLIGAARALTSSLDLETVLHKMTSEVSKVIDGAHGILLFMYDEEHHLLRIRMTGGYFDLDEMRHSVLAPGEGMSGSVFQSGQGRIFHSVEEAEQMMRNIPEASYVAYTKSLGGYFIPTSVISVPMRARDKTIGVLTVDAFDDRITFSNEDLDLLETFAAQASIAIENAMLFARHTRTQLIHEALSKVALARGGTRDITRTLAGMIDEEVVLFDDVFTLLESSSESAMRLAGSMLGTKKEEMIRDVQSGTLQVTAWHADGHTNRSVFFPILSEETTLGYLAVILHETTSLDPLDRFAIEQTSVVFAGEMLRRERDIIEAATARGAVLAPLLDKEWEELSYMQIASLPYYRADEADYIIAHTSLLEPSPEGAKNPLLRYLTRELLKNDASTYILHRGQETTILFTLPASKNQTNRHLVHRRLEEFIVQVERYTGQRVAAGIGRQVQQLKHVRISYKDALTCTEAARSSSSGGIFSPEDLGLDRLFMNMEYNELDGFQDEKLSILRNYDQERSAHLVHTLQLYVEHNQSLKAASNALFIHVNTLKYRLNTIRTLLNMDNLDGKTLFELQLAIYIQEYLQRTNG